MILTGTPTGSTVVRPGDLVEVEVDRGEPAVHTRTAAQPHRGGRLRPRPARRACRSPTTRSARPPTAAGGAPGPADSPRDLLAAVGAVSHRHAAAQLRKRGYNSVTLDRLHDHQPGLKMAGFARTLRYVPFREDLFAAPTARGAERPEARGRAGPARRDPRHRGARRPDRRHGRRHPRAARAGARRARASSPTARSATARRCATLDHPRLLRRDAPRGARPAARTVGDQRHDRLRRRHRDAGRHHRRRRRRRRRHPAHLAKEVAQDAAEQELQEKFIAEQVAKGESVDGLYPIGRRWQAAYEAWLQEKRARHEVPRATPPTIRGSIAPVVSPFTADGAPDLDGLRALIRWQLESGSHGISLGGSTGEPSAQTAAGARRRDQGGRRRDRRPGAVRARHRLGQARRDARAHRGRAGRGRGRGADHHPVLRAADPGGPVPLVLGVAGEFPDLPVIAYNVPSRTAVDIAPETVARLRKAHDNIVGVKETTKDFEHFSRVLHVAGRDTLALVRDRAALPAAALARRRGFVSATANLAPPPSRGCTSTGSPGEFDKARELHFGLHPVTDVIFTETNPAAAKWVLAQAGLIGDRLRPAAAGAAHRGRPGAGFSSCCVRARPCSRAPSPRVAGGES